MSCIETKRELFIKAILPSGIGMPRVSPCRGGQKAKLSVRRRNQYAFDMHIGTDLVNFHQGYHPRSYRIVAQLSLARYFQTTAAAPC